MNRLVLIDGNAVMHRAYHALPPPTSPDGKAVHVVYGFVSMVLKIFYGLKPTHMAVAFDRPGPTFRDKLFPAYQSQRPKMDDDFVSQIPMVHDLVATFGMPIYEMDGFEADDMIGTIAGRVVTGKGGKPHVIDQVVIVTGDRDILQLVADEKVLVYMPTKGLSEGRLYGEREVVERMGLAPKLIVDLKALMGDASDNYPGVPGIGPKTAIRLLAEYGSVENIYKNIEHIPGQTIKNKLAAGKDSAMLGKILATIRNDAPIVFEPEKARVTALNTKSVRDLLARYHFPSLLKRLDSGEGKQETKEIRPHKRSAQQDKQQQELF